MTILLYHKLGILQTYREHCTTLNVHTVFAGAKYAVFFSEKVSKICRVSLRTKVRFFVFYANPKGRLFMPDGKLNSCM